MSSTENARAKSLNDLPNEILLKIFSFVDLHREARIVGYIPDDPPPSPPDQSLRDDFVLYNRWLQHIALTCKRFAALIPEVQLHAVVVSAISSAAISEFKPSSSFGLIIHLSTRPELSRYLKQLRVHAPRGESLIRREIDERQLRAFQSLCLPSDCKGKYSVDVARWCGKFSYSVLLAILPELEKLCIFSPSGVVSFKWADHWSDKPFEPPFLRSLRYLKVESEQPPIIKGLELFQQLDTLDLSMRLHGEEWCSVPWFLDRSFAAPENFHNIKHLRLDFEVRTIGIWNYTKRACMSNLLQGFRNLESLVWYAESTSKNPYSSVRAFPAYQANIQAYPEVLSSSMDVPFDSYWDPAIYDARTEITDYQHLVDGIVHLRPTLQYLQLPGGFWTLPGAVRKPLPRFDQFTRLRKLIVPRAALVSIKLDNMRFDTVSEGDFELSALEALPTSLQHLTIFDVDEAFLESEWLLGLFSEQKSHMRWPDLRILEILITPTFYHEVLDGLETFGHTGDHSGSGVLDELLTRRSEGFEILVGKDDGSFQQCF